ncbi:hypothetical protein HZF05_07210 [Sphingomonas sp. CGMCC 1.13654]|uniref:Uncharacterized protein n=1 Tax=Sphingomonas chungangi TaxID=2683589 RepID=A0A838L4D2_9SPHN|nr:hypothetical protein [Sphingomonas chungangi]MBA2933887.1 hypothetical protein [Sphingomonas chungangi]MVW55216.1 hypothetical protein [Sphingomonas chungangi]
MAGNPQPCSSGAPSPVTPGWISSRGLGLIAALADLLLVRDPGRWGAGLARRAMSIAMLFVMLGMARFVSLREDREKETGGRARKAPPPVENEPDTQMPLL